MRPGDLVAAVAEQLARRVEQRIERAGDGEPAARESDPEGRLGRLDPDLLDEICDAMNQRGVVHPASCGEIYERRLASDRSSRRAGGSYYTPEYLVDFVVSHVLGPVEGGAPGFGMAGEVPARIIDPACGGGVFLLGALDHLAGPRAARRAASDRERVSIVCHQLHGIDIDPTAVTVCRLALALAVSSVDASGHGGEGVDSMVPAEILDAVIDHVRCADALLEQPFDGSFDAVIGNPPWGQKGFRFDHRTRDRLAARYTTARGVLDPFKLFVERAHQIVRPGGVWGLVLPDIILLKDQQAVRDVILSGSLLSFIVDAGRAFPGVNLDTVVLIGRRIAVSESSVVGEHRVMIWHHLPERWRDEPPESHFLAQRVFLELEGHKFNIHLRPESLSLLRSLVALPRLGQFLEAHEGVHSGNVRAKLFRAESVGEHCVPLIVGRREIARYQLRWSGAFLDRAPGLIDRRAGEYANLGRPEWHRRTKIVVRRTGDRIIAALDQCGYHVSNNLFVVFPRKTLDLAEVRAYVALLNSRFMTWYFRTVQPRTGRLFAELKIMHLAGFPRPHEASWRRVIPDLARCVETLERALESGETSESQAPAVEDRGDVIAQAEAEIDGLVAAAFELDPAQRQMVESS